MSERKLTTKEQLQAKLDESRRQLEISQRELEENERAIERNNKRLAASTQRLAIAQNELNSFINISLDINKLTFEAMKHLTTLSVGSILLMVTFLEKLFSTNREWTALVGVALISFVISILCAMSAMTRWPIVLTLLVTAKQEETRPIAIREGKVQRAAFVTFILGITFLVIFAIKNLY